MARGRNSSSHIVLFELHGRWFISFEPYTHAPLLPDCEISEHSQFGCGGSIFFNWIRFNDGRSIFFVARRGANLTMRSYSVLGFCDALDCTWCIVGESQTFTREFQVRFDPRDSIHVHPSALHFTINLVALVFLARLFWSGSPQEINHGVIVR